MRRREFISLIAGAAAGWPLAARAQGHSMPLVGYLDGGSWNKPYTDAFKEGLHQQGYIDGQNVKVVYRVAEGHYDRLPGLATDLARSGAAAIFATGGSVSARATKEATTTIPIVFVNGDDPVKSGLVPNMARPEGNMTGATLFSSALGPKKLELLHELVSQYGTVGVLMNRGNRASEAELDYLLAAAKGAGQNLRVIGVSRAEDIERAFETFASEHVSALLVTTGVFLGDHKRRIVALAASHALPAIYDRSAFAAAGGLITYGTRFPDVFRQGGVYVGRILKGAKPSELPVVQPTRFELVINLKTAHALGLEVPTSILAVADEVIE
jgi:putative tryptophan/tyrosine transport system substrate-binding protein